MSTLKDFNRAGVHEVLLQFAEDVVSTLGYPKLITKLLTKSPFNISISQESGTTISRGAKLRGTIQLHDGGSVESGAELFGDITIGAHTTVRENARIHTDVTTGDNVRIGADSYIRLW